MLESRNEPLKVGKLIANPGERAQSYLHIGEMQDGTAARLPLILIRGKKPGPILYLQAISDGDELNGVGVLYRLLRKIDSNRLRGGLIVAPLVNFHAFHARRAFSPVDGHKMNRCFPGNPDGSSSERIAHVLYESAVRQADLCVDLHQGGVRPMIDEVRVRTASDHAAHEACLELAVVFGIGYILDEQGPDGQLAQAAPDDGIPTIDPELGGCHGWDESSIDKGERGVWNVLYHYGLLDGEPTVPETQTLVRGFVPVRPIRGGFVELCVDLYDRVLEAQKLATVYNLFGEPVENVLSPANGVVWTKSVYPMAATGETILTIGKDPETIAWPLKSASDGASDR